MLGKMVLGLGRLGRGLACALVLVLAACSGESKGGDDDGESEGNGVPTRLETSGVDKVDLLFMIDNSISMADKQRLLVEAVPVLVSRFIDPICVDGDGNPVGGTNSSGCAPNSAEFAPIEDMHIGIITSSLGNHGGDICTPDPMEMPPRPLNDSAQLIASVRTGVYSYTGLGPHGFLVWDPRVSDDRPVPETHPALSNHEQNPQDFITDFASHVAATGERGCGYEASLEAWYRFLIDPEPINQVTRDPSGQFSQRGPINPVVLAQRAAFMRPDSLLAIVMLTDENDCSIDDEEGQQGWLAASNRPMPRGSDACARPDDPNIYRCCIPCVMLDSAAFQPPPGCSYGADISCNAGGGHELTPIEDSANLRCYRQAARFGVDLLYPWERYVQALKAPRIELRAPDEFGNTEVQNPIYTPGADGTPARDPSKVFLAGIVGVPWQDIATGASLSGRGLEYLTAEEMTSPPSGTPGGNRWDLILGDPDIGRLPTDPFMHETIDPRSGTNPVTGDAIMPPSPGSTGNAINGHEQNVVNRDDLQYACIFDLETDVPCDMSNQDGCDCNASEQEYNRPLCQYSGAGTEGVQTHAKAYPGIRHLQVLKDFGDNSIVASICPKNVTAQGGNPPSDPDYGYNPAMAAIVEGVKGAMGMKCLPRPIATNTGSTDCTVVEARLTDDCSCTAPGRGEVPSRAVGSVENGLIAAGLCGGATGISCSDYCLCEIHELTGFDLNTCQLVPVDPETVHGFCYIDPEQGHGTPELVAHCPADQQQLIRFMGDDVPTPGSVSFLSCPSDPKYDPTHPPPL